MADTPNTLGRMLRYFTDAFAYARSAKATGARRYASNPLLSNILEDNSRQIGGGDPGKLDYYTQLGVTNPFFYYALKIISDRVADVGKFSVEQKKDDAWETVEGHEFLDVLASPNSVMTGGLMLGLVSEWLNTVGEAYLFLVTETPGVGPIQEIWPLPSRNMRPEPMSLRLSPYTNKPIIDYSYTLAHPVMLPGENIVHIRTPNLFDFWRGMAPLSALQSILTMDAAETSWLASYFGENNAVPTAIISLPPDIDEATFDVVRRDIVEQFGAQRRSAVTRGGDIKVETFQHTIQEMRVLEGMEFNGKAIWQVLRVPAGLADATSGQSRLAADMALMRDAIQPMLNNIASWLTLKAMPMYGDGLRVMAENVIPQDSAVETAEYAAYSPDRTLQENRERQKLKPLRLTGPLAPYQPLFDQVPQRWVEVFLPLVQQEVAPPQAAPALPGPVSQSGEISPQSEGEIGPRTSGLATQEQAIRDLLGESRKSWLDALPDGEAEAAQAWVDGQKARESAGVAAQEPAGRGKRRFAYKAAGDYRATLWGTGEVSAVYRTRGDGALQRWNGERRRWSSAEPPAGERLIVVDADVVRRFMAGVSSGTKDVQDD